jgi:hypothetical protein
MPRNQRLGKPHIGNDLADAFFATPQILKNLKSHRVGERVKDLSLNMFRFSIVGCTFKASITMFKI